MDNRIDAIRQQQIYRVNPVSLYERRAQQNTIEKSNIFSNSNNSNYNLNHPAVAGGNSNRASVLDLLA